MPAARVADRSPMAHLPLRESAGIGGQQQHHPSGNKGQQQQQQQQQLQQQQQQKQYKEETEQEQNQQQQNSNKMIAAAERSEEQCGREKELCARLLQRREQLEEQLLARLDELKDICIAEGDLVGQLPTEIYKCLLPGETEPTVKRRVGTAFKFPQEVLTTIRHQNSKDNCGTGGPNGERQMTQLEAEVALNRRIVAAAERLAKDKSVNKSVRKKRRKDLQMAAQRLKGLEKGLHRLRLSSSKPDVSTTADGCGAASSASIGHQAGSGFSLNSLKAWPNFYHTLRMSTNTKSCPATPRGSVPDLTMTNGTAVASRRHKQQQQKQADSANDGEAEETQNSRKTTPSTAKKLHKMLSRDQLLSNSAHPSTTLCASSSPSSMCHHQSAELGVPSSSVSASSLTQQPCSTCSASSSSSGISSANPSLSSSTNLLGMTASAAPPVPSRRSSSGGSSASTGGGAGDSTHSVHKNGATAAAAADGDGTTVATDSNSSSHLYANIGYQSSSPYKSAYRQCHFPTLLQQQQQQTSPSLSVCHQQPMTSSTSFSALKDLSSSSSNTTTSSNSRPSCCCSSSPSSSSCSSSSSNSLAAVASSHLGQIVRQLDAVRPPLRGGDRGPLVVVRRSVDGRNASNVQRHGEQHQQHQHRTTTTAHWAGSLDRRLTRGVPALAGMAASAVPRTTLKNMVAPPPSSLNTTRAPMVQTASTTTTTAAIRPLAPSVLPQFSPRVSRTSAVEELLLMASDNNNNNNNNNNASKLITTFPALAATDRHDNGTATNQLLHASARFRSISAVLDRRSAWGECGGEKPFPRPNDRLEALLASIHRQSQVGSIVADISSSSSHLTAPKIGRSSSAASSSSSSTATTMKTTKTTTTLV